MAQESAPVMWTFNMVPAVASGPDAHASKTQIDNAIFDKRLHIFENSQCVVKQFWLLNRSIEGIPSNPTSIYFFGSAQPLKVDVGHRRSQSINPTYADNRTG